MPTKANPQTTDDPGELVALPPRLPALSLEDLTFELDQGYDEKIRAFAQQEAPAAFQTLVDLADSAESESVRRGSAKDILAAAADPKIKSHEDIVGRRPITVNIVNFTGSGTRQALQEAVEQVEELDVTPEPED